MQNSAMAEIGAAFIRRSTIRLTSRLYELSMMQVLKGGGAEDDEKAHPQSRSLVGDGLV